MSRWGHESVRNSVMARVRNKSLFQSFLYAFRFMFLGTKIFWAIPDPILTLTLWLKWGRVVPSIVVEVTKLGAVAKCDFFEPVSHGGSSVVTSFPRTLTLYFFLFILCEIKWHFILRKFLKLQELIDCLTMMLENKRLKIRRRKNHLKYILPDKCRTNSYSLTYKN